MRDGLAVERANLVREQYPEIDGFFVFGGQASPELTVIVVADGKRHCFKTSRRGAFNGAAQFFDALKAMEPGK